jgi:hypothetical protein
MPLTEMGPVAVKAGGWRTLHRIWNSSGTGVFRLPAGAQIKVRYGSLGFFGTNGQTQKLTGETDKRLVIGGGSIVVARMQM